MKTLFLASVLAFSSLMAFGQKDKKDKKVNEKYIFCYKEASLETDDYKIYIVDAVARGEFSKFKIRIFNKTNDFLIFKPQEMTFIGNGQTISGTDKPIIVAPNDETSKVVDFKGSGMQLETYKLEIKGVYKVSANAPAVSAPNFDLPPSKNDFKAGNFNCKILDKSMTTDRTTAKFGCTYEGDGIGIIDPYKCSAIMPNGQENANVKKYNGSLMEKGKYEDFFVIFNELAGAGDMQKKSIQVKWNDTFRESKLTPLPAINVDMVKDEAKTTEKNK